MNETIQALINTKEISRKIEAQERALWKLREQIELQNPQIKEIAQNGFTAVMHKNSISFNDYDKPTRGEIHYGINLEFDPLCLTKKHDDVTDQDVQKIAKILKMEVCNGE